jgi:hypothetical protein
MFQALMNDVLQDFICDFVPIFFDNILIYNNSWSAHLRHVRAVLDRLREHKLVVKRSKCSFDASSVGYLDHMISANGVAMDADKVAAIRARQLPRSGRAVHGFPGLTGYYRKFIRSYGELARSLTQLLKCDAFCWTSAAAVAFETLKAALTSAPVL